MAKKLTAKQQEKQRKEIEENISLYTDIESLFSGSIQDVAKNVLALEERIKTENAHIKNSQGQYFKFKMKVNTYMDSYPELEFKAVRMETDKEYEDRLERNRKASIAKKLLDKKKKEELEAKELAEFERLQKKFGTPILHKK